MINNERAMKNKELRIMKTQQLRALVSLQGKFSVSLFFTCDFMGWFEEIVAKMLFFL